MTDQLREDIATVLAKTNGFETPNPFEHEQASRVWALVAPVLRDREKAAERFEQMLDMARATRVREAANEASKFKELQADLAAARASLDYVEEWVGDLVGDYGVRRPESLAAGLDSVGEMFRLADWLHAESLWQRGDARSVADRFGWRLVEAQQEGDRLRREVEFEANGTNPASQADELDVHRRELASSLNQHPLTTWPELLVEANRVAEFWLDSVAAEAAAEETVRRRQPSPVCACVTALQAQTLRELGVLAPPQCSVHPEPQDGA